MLARDLLPPALFAGVQLNVAGFSAIVQDECIADDNAVIVEHPRITNIALMIGGKLSAVFIDEQLFPAVIGYHIALSVIEGHDLDERLLKATNGFDGAECWSVHTLYWFCLTNHLRSHSQKLLNKSAPFGYNYKTYQ